MASSSSGDEDCVSRGHSEARGTRKSQEQPEDMEDLEEEQGEEEEDVLREKTSKLRRQQRQSLREIVQDTHSEWLELAERSDAFHVSFFSPARTPGRNHAA